MYIFVTFSRVFSHIPPPYAILLPQKPRDATPSFIYTSQIWTCG